MFLKYSYCTSLGVPGAVTPLNSLCDVPKSSPSPSLCASSRLVLNAPLQTSIAPPPLGSSRMLKPDHRPLTTQQIKQHPLPKAVASARERSGKTVERSPIWRRTTPIWFARHQTGLPGSISMLICERTLASIAASHNRLRSLRSGTPCLRTKLQPSGLSSRMCSQSQQRLLCRHQQRPLYLSEWVDSVLLQQVVRLEMCVSGSRLATEREQHQQRKQGPGDHAQDHIQDPVGAVDPTEAWSRFELGELRLVE